MQNLTIYVPNRQSSLLTLVKPGAGIVGSCRPVKRVLCDYEGNLYGAENLKSWEERVYQAASRHVHDYPTNARCLCDPSDILPVGTIRMVGPHFGIKLNLDQDLAHLQWIRWLWSEAETCKKRLKVPDTGMFDCRYCHHEQHCRLKQQWGEADGCRFGSYAFSKFNRSQIQ